jgi:hypothetical protein
MGVVSKYGAWRRDGNRIAVLKYFSFIVYYNFTQCPFYHVPEYCTLIAWEACVRHLISYDSCGARGRHKRDTCNLNSVGIMSGPPKCSHVMQHVRIACRRSILHTNRAVRLVWGRWWLAEWGWVPCSRYRRQFMAGEGCLWHSRT